MSFFIVLDIQVEKVIWHPHTKYSYLISKRFVVGCTNKAKRDVSEVLKYLHDGSTFRSVGITTINVQ